MQHVQSLLGFNPHTFLFVNVSEFIIKKLKYLHEYVFSMSGDKKNNDYIYDIAFSFAGEQREYVSQLHKILTEKYNVRVFYDKDLKIQIDLWGKDLAEEFQKIYEKQSKWCLLFISKDYKEKFWARHEKRSALARAIREKGTYLLPARFDDIEIDGIPSTTSVMTI